MKSSAWSLRAPQVLRLGLGLVLASWLMGCQRPERQTSETWQIYHNPRYDFEFPHPRDWTPSSPPDNQDGQAFRDPKSPTTEIRGWASYDIQSSSNPQTAPKPKPLQPNFKTRQGIAGELTVDLGSDMSSMRLVIEQGDMRYYWQGRSPQQQFDDYYQLFSYIASQYRIPPQPTPSPGGQR